jgi:hypothetical protein
MPQTKNRSAEPTVSINKVARQQEQDVCTQRTSKSKKSLVHVSKNKEYKRKHASRNGKTTKNTKNREYMRQYRAKRNKQQNDFQIAEPQIAFRSTSEVKQMRHNWERYCKSIITEFKACAFCGKVVYGGKHAWHSTSFSKVQPTEVNTDPPILLYNPFLQHNVTTNDGFWWCCGACSSKESREKRTFYNVKLWPTYVRNLLSLPPTQPLLLSVMKCGVRFAQRICGFLCTNSITQTPYLIAPLIKWPYSKSNTSTLPNALKEVLHYNLENNPIIRTYVTQIETEHAPDHGVPIIHHECIQDIVAKHTARDPTHHQQVPVLNRISHEMEHGMNFHSMPHGLSSFAEMDNLQESTNNFKVDQKYHAGNCVLRSNHCSVRVEVNANGVDQCPKNNTLPSLSVESATCPFLFPNGIGWCDGKYMSMVQYIKLRITQLFSAFTLCHVYVMIMFQIFQISILLNNLTEARLESDLKTYYKQHPESKPIDAMRQVTKRTIPSALVGSPAYHRKALQDLLAMVNEYGLPSFFLTLTSDELSEYRWTEYENLEDFLERYLNPSSWTDAPVECARLFHDRVEGFMHNFILDDKHRLLGRVLHYVTRYESQHRGSLHAHILLWVDERDIESVAMEITASYPGRVMPSLEDENKYIRIPPTPSSVEEHLYYLVARKQMHKCDYGPNGCCAKDKTCKYMFPSPPNLSGTIYNEQHGRYIYLRINSEDAYVVPYHPIILLLWNAHMNIQRITATQWSYYILKYTTKLEPHGALHCDERAAQSLGLHGLSKHEQQLISAAILTKPIAPCEAALIMSGIPIIHSDVSVVYVDTKPPEFSEVYNMAGGTFTRTSISHVSQYLGRPKCLKRGKENVSFKQYFVHYESRPPTAKFIPRNSELLETDEFQQKIYKLQHPRCVRFTNYHPVHHTQAFFYNILIHHSPFQSEEDIAPHNGCYFAAACARGIIMTTDCLERIIHQYCDYNLYEETQLDNLVQHVIQNLLGSQHLSLTPFSSAFDEHLPLTDTSTIIQNVHDILDIQQCVDIEIIDNPSTLQRTKPDLSMLSTEQLAPIKMVQEYLASRTLNAEPNLPPKLVVISGGPGTGKTFTSNKLIEYCVDLGYNVYTCATTGAAALRITATSNLGTPTTVHSAMQIPAKGPLRPLPVKLIPKNLISCRDVRRLLITADVILCDEMSMLTNALLQMMIHRVRMTTLENAKTKVLVLVGDRSQLPPVCLHCGKCVSTQDEGEYHSDDEDEQQLLTSVQLTNKDIHEANEHICKLCHIMYSTTVQQATQFDFTHVYRQDGDLEYLQFLNIIRVREPTQQEITSVLKQRFRVYIKRSDVKTDLTPDTTFICTHYRDVVAYNELVLNWMSKNNSKIVGRIFYVEPHHNLTLDEQIQLKKWFKNRRHNSLTKIAIGARVMITKNINLARKMANGATGVVQDVIQQGGKVVKILVKLDSDGKVVTITRSNHYTCYHNNRRLHKDTFPLILAYAITAHKCQGMTMSGRTFIHVRDSFAPGLLYVMLSRVPCRKMLYIIGVLSPSDFRPVTFPTL